MILIHAFHFCQERIQFQWGDTHGDSLSRFCLTPIRVTPMATRKRIPKKRINLSALRQLFKTKKVNFTRKSLNMTEKVTQ